LELSLCCGRLSEKSEGGCVALLDSDLVVLLLCDLAFDFELFPPALARGPGVGLLLLAAELSLLIAIFCWEARIDRPLLAPWRSRLDSLATNELLLPNSERCITESSLARQFSARVFIIFVSLSVTLSSGATCFSATVDVATLPADLGPRELGLR
jgi:hypothetical protein